MSAATDLHPVLRATRRPPGADSAAAAAVLERTYAAIARRAPAIAEPVLDRAAREGRITLAERRELRAELRAPGACGEGGWRTSLPARRALREALAAVRREAPAIAAPILDEAVAQQRLTRAQRERILDRLRMSPARSLGRRRCAAVPRGGSRPGAILIV